MVTEFYEANPVCKFRVCENGECDSLGSKGDDENAINEGKEESTWCVHD